MKRNLFRVLENHLELQDGEHIQNLCVNCLQAEVVFLISQPVVLILKAFFTMIIH